jgi:O-antigen/teichoic acid export membrane protein
MIKTAASFLFENKTTKQTLFKNTFWITLSGGICKMVRAFIVIYIARALGPSEYGKFAFALAFVSLFVSFFDMGIPAIVTRDFAKKQAAKEEFNPLVSLRIFLGILNILLVFTLSFFITKNPEIQKLIMILITASFLGQFPEIFYALFRGREKMEYESFANVFQVLLLFGFVFITIFNFLSPQNISLAYLFSNLIALIAVFLFFYYRFMPFKFLIDINVWKKFLITAWPLALISIFGMIYNYFDSTFLGYIGQVKETGLYNAAIRIINIIVLPSSIITMTFYPVLSRFSEERKSELQKVFNYQMKILFIIAVFLIATGLIFAPQIIFLVIG